MIRDAILDIIEPIISGGATDERIQAVVDKLLLLVADRQPDPMPERAALASLRDEGFHLSSPQLVKADLAGDRRIHRKTGNICSVEERAAS